MKTVTIRFLFALVALAPAFAFAGAEPPRGAPENAWRYQLYNGRWWYWTPHEQWSFHDGRRWVTLSSATGSSAPAGSPRQQALAPLGGRLPMRTYSNFGGSPFYGPAGQAPQGQQPATSGAPVEPMPPGGLGRSRSAAGASELGISGSRSGDANSGVGGGSVGGTNITGGQGQPTRP